MLHLQSARHCKFIRVMPINPNSTISTMPATARSYIAKECIVTTCICTHSYMLMHTHSYMHAYIRTYTRVYTHTIHTHTQIFTHGLTG